MTYGVVNVNGERCCEEGTSIYCKALFCRLSGGNNETTKKLSMDSRVAELDEVAGCVSGFVPRI